ncbi:unnamed protein product, partial [Linum tenue]
MSLFISHHCIGSLLGGLKYRTRAQLLISLLVEGFLVEPPIRYGFSTLDLLVT